MAATQEFYRNSARLPRYSTKLNALANGMYLTEQTIPEGYAKVLVNYDIDDTGSNIRNRNGRELLSTITIPGHNDLGPMHLTDYAATYNKEETEIESIKDVVLSYGNYDYVRSYTPNSISIPKELDIPVYVARFTLTTDNNRYDDEGEIIEEGTKDKDVYNNVWALYCDKGSEDFKTVVNENIGYFSARTIKNAYVYDKPVKELIGKPISTVLSNELYAFSGAPIEAYTCPSNLERDSFYNYSKPDLTKLILKSNGNGTYSLKRKVLEPRKLNVAEAHTTGYNILDDSPYVFEDVEGGAPAVLASITYETKDSDLPILKCKVGTKYAQRIYYQYKQKGTVMQYKVQIRDYSTPTSSLQTLKNWTDFKAGDPIFFDFTPTYLKTYLFVTIRNKDDAASEYAVPDLVDCSEDSNVDLELKEYDLSSAKGMVSWQGCIGLYGVNNAPETIFFSDVEDPSYFPFPNNIITFDNEILAVHKYLDMLLVITTDGIWLVNAGSSFAKVQIKRILSNLFIPELDAINVVILKDQIFFKTDTQFYVLKPNAYTSDATDLRNFTNSTAIANYTLDFTKQTLNILNKVFRKLLEKESKIARKKVEFTDFDVINVQSIVKNSDVHYVHTIVPYVGKKSFGELNLHLVYDTVTRSYRMYLLGIGDESISHSALLYRNKQSGSYYEIIPFNGENKSEIAIVKSSMNRVSDDIVVMNKHLTPHYNNFQYINTGNIALEDTYNKRFREVQFNLLNKEHESINFYSDFKIDGKSVVTSIDYEVQQITDANDPEYGMIYVTPTSKENVSLYGDTTLDGENYKPKYWQVDLSKFPDLTIATVRMQLLGKGRRGSLELLNESLKKYTLGTMVWVYRIMNVR